MMMGCERKHFSQISVFYWYKYLFQFKIMVHVVITKPAKNASAAYIWGKLAEYSDMSWHPDIKESKNIGTINDGSENMVGAVRVLTKSDDHELTETVTEWSNEEMKFTMSIDKGGPTIAKSLIVTFAVRNEPQGVLVDMIINMQLVGLAIILTPLLKLALPKKLGPLLDGIANLKE
jgi:hypothetical protein